MNIACMIREQRRWGLNGLLTRPLNTGSMMEGKGEKEAEREREGPKYWQKESYEQGRKLRASGGGGDFEDGKVISGSKGRENCLIFY